MKKMVKVLHKGMHKEAKAQEMVGENNISGGGWEMLSLEEALEGGGLHTMNHVEGCLPHANLACILHKCREVKNHANVLHLHSHMHKGGLETHRLFGNYLVQMLVEVGSMHDAQQVFDRLVYQNECSWNSLVRGYIRCGELRHALMLYQKMQENSVHPDRYTFVALLKACVKLKDVERGIEIHAQIDRKGLASDLFIASTLVDMYTKCGLLVRAHQVLDKLPIRDVVSWTALIAGYVEHGHGKEALGCFEQMRFEGISPDAVTFVCSLKACGTIGAIDKGRQIHAEIVRKGFLERDLVVGNALVDMYAKCGLLANAQKVFDKLPSRDAVSWNALIAGYVKHGLGEEALNRFEQMKLLGVSPDAVTLVCSLKACGSIGATDKGYEIHCEIARKGLLETDLVVGNALVDMYASCGLLTRAQEEFNKLPVRDVVTWTALISGYAKQGCGEEALNCFECIQLEGISPNAVTFISTLKACGSIGATEKGQEIHAEIARKGLLESDLVVGDVLVDMYASCGLFAEAHGVFDKLPARDAVAWTALMAGYAKHKRGKEALDCFEKMQLEGLSPDVVTFVCSLKACSCIGAIDKGQELHCEIVRKGSLERDLVVGNALVDMYASCGLLATAQEVFDKLPGGNVISWTAIIAGYAEHGHGEEALNCFERMQLEGISPDAVTFVCTLKACSSIGAVDKGQEIHAQIGLLERDLVVGSTLVEMYANCGLLAEAYEVFDRLSVRDVVSWTSLIAGYAKYGRGAEALSCFEEMQHEGISPNALTIVCSLKACGSIGAVDKGQDIHAEIARKGMLEMDPLVGNALIDMYINCGLLAKAREVFDNLPVRDTFSWTALIAAYANHECGEEALKCFEEMRLEGIPLDDVTFVCGLKACGSTGAVDKGQGIHDEIARKGLLERDLVVGNALVDMYVNCGLLAKAQEVFDKLPIRDIVSWTVLVAGYAKHGLGEEALDCFEKMQLEGVSLDPVMSVCSLKACGSIGAIDKGQKLYAEIVKKGLLERDLGVGNTVVDMYAKCGFLAKAEEVFNKLPVHDVVSWNALITGYAQLGQSVSFPHIFDRMRGEGNEVNTVTFVSVLNACSHAGLVDKGQAYFEAMREDYGITPTLEHHMCMVDLLGRAGQLDKVVEMITVMPFHPNLVMWHTVLGACRKWGNMELGRHAYEHAVQLDEEDAAAYICMSNIYVDADMQENLKRVEAMRVKK